MKKIMFLMAILVMMGCSVESIDEFTTLDAKAKTKSVEASNENPMGFYTGQNNGRQLQGTLSITNDCNYLYLEITPEGDDPDEVNIWLFTELPALNGGGNNIPGDSQYDLDNADGLTWSFPLADFDTEQEILVFTKAWGSFAGTSLHEEVAYTAYEFDLENCCEESFSYTQNEDGSYTFTYIAEEDMEDAELTFTFPQIVTVEDLSDWIHNGQENAQTFKTSMNIMACTTYDWTVILDAECNASNKAILWTDFKVNDISKKDDLGNIVKVCE